MALPVFPENPEKKVLSEHKDHQETKVLWVYQEMPAFREHLENLVNLVKEENVEKEENPEKKDQSVKEVLVAIKEKSAKKVWWEIQDNQDHWENVVQEEKKATKDKWENKVLVAIKVFVEIKAKEAIKVFPENKDLVEKLAKEVNQEQEVKWVIRVQPVK